ncbi:MAG TPA: DUF3375 domain-containing protein [Hyphomicrobiaceae bacterium]|nr:DUF3375 domain-containing protein [Hyphomicrobiaceae bacterium]
MSIDDRDDDPLAARGSTYPSGALSIHQIGGDRVMDYETLDSLRQNHPAWKLLRAGHAALIVSFLHRTYIKPNVRTLRESELASRLEDTLFHLRQGLGSDAFPRDASGYLDDWASDNHGWLRKYYAPDSDEPSFDITSATEQAIAWLASLSQRIFIGTESRLLTVFELLRQLAEGTETDPQVRIAELERRRAEIDSEIARIREGVLPLIDNTGVRERFLQIASTAQGLLSDFRAVEQNFRDLDRATRERIATWEGGKGDLLLEIFGKRDAIADSDQGKSFRAFWDFLMSAQRQEELTLLLEKVFALAPIQELQPDRRILRIHYDWLAAGEVTQRTVAKLSAELRRYLDDKAWLENRRIMDILREIEIKALAVRDAPPRDAFMELDDMAPNFSLVMDRPLFTPPHKPEIDDSLSFSTLDDIPADALFDRVFVDKERLATYIRRALQRRDQVSLSEIVEANPLEHGLAELIAYLALASEDAGAVIEDQKRQTVVWTDDTGRRMQATMPLVVFARTAARPDDANAAPGVHS